MDRISFVGSSGDVKLTVENGPLDVKLQGDSWRNGTLIGTTENGPVSLAVGDGYRSGVSVTASRNSPWHCKLSACRSGRQTWEEDERRLELGSAPLLVRLSTINGPVAIKTLEN